MIVPRGHHKPGLRLLLGLLLLLTAAAVPGSSAETVHIEPGVGRIFLSPHLRWLEDPEGRLDLRVVRRALAEGRFRRFHEDIPNFRYTNSVLWFHVRLRNDSTDWLRRLLEIGYPLLDDIRVFVVYSDKPLRRFLGGDRRPFSSRYIQNTHFLFPIELGPDEHADLFLRVRTGSALLLPANLWSPEAFHSSDHRRQFGDGLYYGALLAMLVFNVVVFLFIRDGYYPLYLGFLAGFILFQSTLDGYAYEYLWPDSPTWNDKALSIFIPLTLLFLVLFMRAFLQLRARAPGLDRVYRIMGWVMVTLILLAPWLSYHTSIRLETLVTLPLVILVLFTPLRVGLQGNRPALIIFASWMALLLGILLYLMQVYDLLPVNLLTLSAIKFGALLQVLGFAVALLDRVRTLVVENRSMQHQRQQRLEALVEARTRELDAALAELERANRELAEQNSRDQLTGVRNRRFFDEHLNRAWEEAARSKRPLSLLMMDLDHFKRINDCCGHPAGDEALRQVARVLDEQLKRAGDQLIRYGGEEFAALLHDTALPGALRTAERLRQAVEQTEFEIDGRRHHFTISIGVACRVPEGPEGAERLLMLADHALYRAKAAGRNRVEAGEAGDEISSER